MTGLPQPSLLCSEQSASSQRLSLLVQQKDKLGQVELIFSGDVSVMCTSEQIVKCVCFLH